MRTVYYAYDFILDFLRTLNVLSLPTDSTAKDQAKEFGSVVSTSNESEYFTSNSKDKVIVTVAKWDLFTKVMNYLMENEKDQVGSSSWEELVSVVNPGKLVNETGTRG